MSKLQIIYTPDTDQFRLDPDTSFVHWRLHRDSPKELNLNYKCLRQHLELPDSVGVVTFPLHIKFISKLIGPVGGSPTNHKLLAVLEKMLELEKEPHDGPFEAEYIYRQMGVLLSHHAITMDASVCTIYGYLLANASLKPIVIRSIDKSIEIMEYLHLKWVQPGGYAELLENLQELMHSFPGFETIREIKCRVENGFNKNKVSREFPLLYIPKEYSKEMLFFSVGLKGETVTYSETVKAVLGVWEAHFRDMVMPETLKRWVDEDGTNLGRTHIRKNLDDLLKDLPEPKTIITDIYIVDHCPQLAEIDFETFEFNLNSQPSSPSQQQSSLVNDQK